MRDRELLLARLESLLEGDSPAYRPLSAEAPPTDRLARISRALSGLGIELWEGLPRPAHTVGLAALAVAELGLLVSPPGTSPQAAASLVLFRLGRPRGFRRPRRRGRRRPSRASSSLARAFWCFTGVAAEIAGGDPCLDVARRRAGAAVGHLVGFLALTRVLGVAEEPPLEIEDEAGFDVETERDAAAPAQVAPGDAP